MEVKTLPLFELERRLTRSVLRGQGTDHISGGSPVWIARVIRDGCLPVIQRSAIPLCGEKRARTCSGHASPVIYRRSFSSALRESLFLIVALAVALCGELRGTCKLLHLRLTPNFVLSIGVTTSSKLPFAPRPAQSPVGIFGEERRITTPSTRLRLM